MRITQAMLRYRLKRALFGDDIRPFRVRVGLNRGLTFCLHPCHQASRLVGLDETELSSVFSKLARKARSAVDLGASDGWYAVHCATRPNIEKVLAFEPVPELVERIHANAELNGCASKMRVVPRYVGNSYDKEWCRLDDYADAVIQPVLVKIDVEGGELDALRGARRLLSNPQTIWVIETHSRNLEIECDRLLKEYGYTTTVVSTGWYRRFLPDVRGLEHNRWLTAART